MDLGCLPKLGPWLVTLVWMTPCLETLPHRLCVFLGENISFLEAKAIYIEQLLSYRKKGEQILEVIRSFLWHKKCVSDYSAIKLLVICLFFASVEYTTPSLLFILFEDQVCLWLISIIFLPNLKERVPFQFVNESYEKQEVAKIVCQVWGYNPFLASLLRTCSHERFENLVQGFFQKLKFKENVSRQHLFAYSCGLGLLFMSFHLVKWSKSRNVRPLSLDLITILHSSWLTTSCLKLPHAIK